MHFVTIQHDDTHRKIFPTALLKNIDKVICLL